jgi:non-specific serine/threonine protein kinase
VIDQSRRELLVDGLPVDIAPKPFDLLVVLAAACGRVVAREELIERVWGGRPTVDNVVATTVNRLRAALGEQHADLIESVPKVGYRIQGPVQATPLGAGSEPKPDLRSGSEVPGRPDWTLDKLLAESTGRKVWLAHQPGQGASRIFKFASSDQGLADLRREAGIARVLKVALGDRPDICAVVDWNFETPPFFIAMPYAGEELGAWLLRSGWLDDPDPDRRLGLFIQIAEALAASHSVGVLHKDLKPENILVEDHADGLRLRLTDFGSGQLTDPDVLEKLGLTSFGLSGAEGLLSAAGWGSLKYLAPELLQDQPATVGSDVYALGVLLYQLLIGDLSRPLTGDWRQQVADPLIADDIADATASEPKRRTLTAQAMAERVRQMPERRAAAVLAQREAEILARERASNERARQRRPWLIGLFATLIVGLSMVSVLYLQLFRARAAESRLLTRVKALNSFLIDDLIGQANPDISGRADLPVAEAARRASAAIDTRFAESGAETRVQVHQAMADAFAGIGKYPEAEREIQAALDSTSRDNDTDPSLVAELHATKARFMAEMDRVVDADRELSAARAAWPDIASARGRRASLYWFARGVVAQSRLENAESASLYRSALERAGGPGDLSVLERERIRFYLADALRMSGKASDAEAELEALIRERAQRLGADHPLTCFTQVLLARVEGDLKNRLPDGIAHAERAAHCLANRVGEDSRDSVYAAEVLADLHFQSDDFARAAGEYDSVAASFQRVDGAVTLRYLTAKLNAGESWHYAGDLPHAENALRLLTHAAEQSLGSDHPIVSTIRYHLVDCQLDRAGALDPRQLAMVADDLARLDPAVLNRSELEPDWDGRLAFQRGRLALRLGRTAEGLRELEQARVVIEARHPDGRINAARIRAEVARWTSSARTDPSR